MRLFGFLGGRQRETTRAEPLLSRVSAAAVQNAGPNAPSSDLANPDPWLWDYLAGGVDTGLGPVVTEEAAMRVSTVFGCVSLLSGLMAALPLRVWRRDTPYGPREDASDNRVAPLLARVPFPGRPLTSFAWRFMWGADVYLRGDHFSAIRYDNAGRVIGFEPIPPAAVTVHRTPQGRNVYECRRSGADPEFVDQDDMLHIPGPGFDGVRGRSRISMARTAIAGAMTFEEQAIRIHENSARPSAAVTLPSNVTPEGKRRIEAFFRERAVGRTNAGRVLYLDADQTYTPMQLSPEDMGTLEMRRYTSADICRFFGVPPHIMGEAAGTSAWGSGIEQLTIGFLRFTLEPELQRVEHELNAKLFDARSGLYAEYDRDALAAMDAKTAAEVTAAEINAGVSTPNEARRKRNRPDMAGGDQIFVQANLVPAPMAGKQKPAGSAGNAAAP